MKEHPKCRKVIEQEGFKPDVIHDEETGKLVWDSYSVIYPDGSRATLYSGLESQMRRMVALGDFPLEGDLLIDIDRWWSLHDRRPRPPFRGIVVMR
jgi:hypothetical protein